MMNLTPFIVCDELLVDSEIIAGKFLVPVYGIQALCVYNASIKHHKLISLAALWIKVCEQCCCTPVQHYSTLMLIHACSNCLGPGARFAVYMVVPHNTQLIYRAQHAADSMQK
jgi:hypothetical protein